MLVMVVISFLSSLLATGCTRFISPEIGTMSLEDSRVSYKAGEKQSGVLDSKDLSFTYTLVEKDNGARLTGELVFDRSLTDSFPGIKSFFLKMNWLDEEGQVLQTVDITPFYMYLGNTPQKLKIDKDVETAPGAMFINFNYYGVFRGEKPDVSEEWDIFLFPFDRT